jgi:hypothetical protein
MLRMQYGHAATLLTKYRLTEPQNPFPAPDLEHRRQLERVRDSLLRRPEADGVRHHARREG